MTETPRTDAHRFSYYACSPDGVGYVEVAFAERLERELNEATAKLRLARDGIVTIAHGKESMRDYANKILADTALYDSSNTRGERTACPKGNHEHT